MRKSILALALPLGLLAACSNAENAAADLGNTADSVGDTLGNAADDAITTIDNATDDFDERADKVGNAIENAVE